jgi:putative peptidoglycan lipid II flippase
MIIASFLGAQLYLDVFYSLNVLIGLIIIVFADQMEMVLSCEATRISSKEPEKLRNFECQAFSASLLIGAGLCAILWITLPVTTPLILPQLGTQEYSTASWILLGLLPFALLYIPFRVLLALLRGRGAVTFSIISDALQSMLLCGCTLITLSLATDGDARTSVVRLAVAHGVAFTLSTLITFLYWWGGVRGNPLARFDLPFARIIAAPLTELSLLNYLLFAFTLIDRRYAGVAQTGGIALLSYASSLSMTARSIINYEQLHVLDFAASEDRQYALHRAVWHCLLLSIPLGLMLVFFSENIVRLVYERGAFSPQMTFDCAAVLRIYGSATALFLIWQIALRMLQVERLVGPLIILVCVLLPLDLFLAQIMVPLYGVSGAVLSTVLMYFPLVLAAHFTLRYLKGTSLLTLRMLLAASLYALFCSACGTLVVTSSASAWGTLFSLSVFAILSGLPLPFLWQKATLDTLLSTR